MRPSSLSNLRSWGMAGGIFASRTWQLLPANINPLGSFGFYSQNTLAFLVSFIAFDWLVGGFYPGFWLTYLGFACYPLFGWLADTWQKNTGSFLPMIWLLPTASFSFFIISNAGVWWYWYPRSLEGLITCYTLALPFYSRTLAGDLLFGWGYLALKQKTNIWNRVQVLVQPDHSVATPKNQPSPTAVTF